LSRIVHPLSRALTRLLRAAVALFIAAVVLLTAALQAGTIGPWWLELARYLPLPLLVLPLLAALVVSLRWLGRGWALACAATLALFVTLTLGFEWHAGDSAVDGKSGVRLRLMTYNIKAYRAEDRPGGFDELAREVALQRPDILMMQDAGEMLPDREPGKPWPGPVFGLPNVYAVGQFIIASRHPLHECGVGRVGRPGAERGYAHCVASVDGIELKLATTHFESPRSGLNAARHEGLEGADEWRQNYAHRLTQATGFQQALADMPRPLVVSGDLNAPESSSVVRRLLAVGLRDAFSSAGRGFGYSYGHSFRLRFSFLRIDHILISPGIGVADCFVGSAVPSEHRPVIADLMLKR
jgi:endonuclease/exonuclease/phosphatase (EEP) superfamily protein YafD